MTWERIKHLVKKEFIQVFRDPRMKGVIFLMPIIQVLVFGYAVTTDLREARTAVLDFDDTIASREYISKFAESRYFDIRYVQDEREIHRLMDRGGVQAALVIRHGFENDVRAARAAPVQFIVDGTDSNTAGILLDYSARITRRFSGEVTMNRLSLRSQPASPIEVETRAWFNENLESRAFYVPGVIAIIVMLITLMLTSMAIVREKEIGTMEQLLVTPLSAPEFIIGKMLPFALIGLVDVLAVTLVAVFWFEVPVRGNLFLLLISAVLFLLTTLGVGLFISTVSGTQQQAMMTTFFFYFPAVLLSGFMFPIANMPLPVQWLTYINPLRYFLVIIRGIFLKGVGIDILWPQMLALALLGAGILGLAVYRFGKTSS
ncbi:MAG: ABC transporter permease [Candidatus Abyssobacteria bacterium SURF_5]|uniref:Transport permease protein n=1 Tax=Abyssobacteria bacterium (strain SURF_5) TaxID=2093360 RepID=A0A3A4P397_ABYX5|nr:MAG: ABC transporter permease [Candidatus Abyssubacteria bacterium SURF_5]